MKKNIAKIIVIVSYLAIVCATIHRDIKIEQQYQGVTGDLRNRIVGARLQKDGISPYFYKWKSTDGIRYYDPNNFEPYAISYTTSSPFFHHLIYPIVEFEQKTIAHIWLIIEYIMFFVCVGISLKLAQNSKQQLLVLAISILLLFTYAWRLHVVEGQHYFFIPFFFLLFFFFMKEKKSLLYAFAGGLCATLIIFIRPSVLIFFLPFLLLIKQYGIRYLVVFFIPFVLVAGWSLINQKERSLWVDYKNSALEHIRYHQHLNPVEKEIEPDPNYKNWEGWQQVKEKDFYLNNPFHVDPQFGNMYFLYKIFFHKKMPLHLLNLFSLISVIVLFGSFYFYHKRFSSFSFTNICMIGFCLYMIVDLFSPIVRYQYYITQWTFPLLIAALSPIYKRSQVWLLLLALAGFFLNTLNVKFIPQEHTMGEYLMLLAFILLSFNLKTAK